MRRFEWNALRPGDTVLVHDDRTPLFDTDDGVVVIVQPETRLNEIAIRVSHEGDTPDEIIRPRRGAVHLSPIDPDDDCWRCVSQRVQRAPQVDQPVPG